MSTELPTRVVPPPPPERSAPPRLQARRSWVAKIAIVTCGAIALCGGLVVAGLTVLHGVSPIRSWYIPSAAMEPALKVGDRVVTLKRGVHRGDIVVFKAPPEERTLRIQDLVKRVVGLPGETIEARDGHVYADGRRLEESYLPRGTITDDLPRQTVPPHRFFVLGDNRVASSDSRVFGSIATSSVVGVVVVKNTFLLLGLAAGVGLLAAVLLVLLIVLTAPKPSKPL